MLRTVGEGAPCAPAAVDERKYGACSARPLGTRDVRPFQCPVCFRGFRRLAHRTRHTRTHSGERPHQCAKCGKRYGRADELKRHLKSHSKAGRSRATAAKRHHSKSEEEVGHPATRPRPRPLMEAGGAVQGGEGCETGGGGCVIPREGPPTPTAEGHRLGQGHQEGSRCARTGVAVLPVFDQHRLNRTFPHDLPWRGALPPLLDLASLQGSCGAPPIERPSPLSNVLASCPASVVLLKEARRYLAEAAADSPAASAAPQLPSSHQPPTHIPVAELGGFSSTAKESLPPMFQTRPRTEPPTCGSPRDDRPDCGSKEGLRLPPISGIHAGDSPSPRHRLRLVIF